MCLGLALEYALSLSTRRRPYYWPSLGTVKLREGWLTAVFLGVDGDGAGEGVGPGGGDRVIAGVAPGGARGSAG